MVNCTSGWPIYSPLCNFKLISGFYFEITQCRLTWLAWSVTQHMCFQAFNQSKTDCQPKAWDGVPCISANQATCCHPPWVLWFHRPIVMWSDMWLEKEFSMKSFLNFSIFCQFFLWWSAWLLHYISLWVRVLGSILVCKKHRQSNNYPQHNNA